ncbi:hypothetical protein Plec18167_001882 [Paecilomyces lecythidis]|uniref:Uncharacterized protein n=1 Tax=Paecilomyces lecythidis TaxID=3004212 RepID=A0ABR3YB47_9EURO
MGGYEWVEGEIALILYLSSAGIQHRAIVDLLRERKFSRTITAVRNKLAELRTRKSLGHPFGRWNVDEVDHFIVELSTKYDIDRILRPTWEDQQIVNQSHRDLDLQVLYHDRGACIRQQAMVRGTEYDPWNEDGLEEEFGQESYL